MNYSIYRGLIIILIFSVNTVFSQTLNEQFEYFDSKYGKNQELYKGIKYLVENRCDFGSPFLFLYDIDYCSISIQNKTFENITLNYDLYNQNIVLRFINHIGASNQIILNESEIDWIKIDGKYLIKNEYKNIKSQFVQVISGQSAIVCLISYNKEYGYKKKGSIDGFGYSNIIQNKFILFNGSAIKFKNKKGFVKYLPESTKASCLDYLKNTNIKMRKLSDYELQKLVIHLNNSIIPIP